MKFSETDICRITQSIWATVLGLEVRPAVGEDSKAPASDFLTGHVCIGGLWEGTAILCCSANLARQAAAIMFGSDNPGLEEVRDAVGELTNITGGNIKSLLAYSCHLSLPAVSEGKLAGLNEEGSVLLNQVRFECQGEPLEVSIAKGAPPTSDRVDRNQGIAGFRKNRRRYGH